jgi:hypothetical protein
VKKINKFDLIPDESILLSFIRSRKYTMDRVFESFDKTSVVFSLHREWFDCKGVNLQRVLDLYNSGYLKVMTKRDSEGRRVILCNNKYFDLDKYNAEDIFRINCLIVSVLSIEEETQLSGIVYVIDFRENNSMKFFTSFPLKPLSEFAAQMKFMALRIKRIVVVGLPTYATQFINIIKIGMSEKMRKRMEIVEDSRELWNVIDRSVMTEDIGGDESEQETMVEFKNFFDANLDRVQKFLECDVDLKRAGILGAELENIGSFRKLEID